MNKILVVPKADKVKAGKVIAYVDGLLCLFEEDSPVPPIGVPVEVMVTRVRHHKDPSNTYFDESRPPKFLNVRVVTDSYVKVTHSGFECAGSMCTTTAYGMVGTKHLMLTPGRIGVWVADNVNTGRVDYSTRKVSNDKVALRPGYAYVSRHDLLKSGAGVTRIEGIGDLEELDFRVRQREREKVEADMRRPKPASQEQVAALLSRRGA